MAYTEMIQALVPLYVVMALGYLGGRLRVVDDFTLDRLNAFNAKFALPGLLFRNLANCNLFDADYGIVGASLLFKAVSAMAIFAYCFVTRSRHGPATERALVAHSVLTLPNNVVIGVPVLSAVLPPAKVQTLMSLLCLEQAAVHLTSVAFIFEMFVSAPPPASVGEHAHGALHMHGPPTRTDPHGWAAHVVDDILSRGNGAAVSTAPRVSVTRRLSSASLSPGAHGEEHSHELVSMIAASADAEAPESGSHDGVGGDADTAGKATPGGEASHGCARALRILRDRLLVNPVVVGAVGGIITSLAVKTGNHERKVPVFIDTSAAYLNNCVLGISLFNIGLFAATHGVVSCGYRRAADTVFMRCVLSPLGCLAVMNMLSMRGDLLKIMVLQGALPQAVASFVLFKEYKLAPELMATSTVLTTLLCMPTMLVWYLLLISV